MAEYPEKKTAGCSVYQLYAINVIVAVLFLTAKESQAPFGMALLGYALNSNQAKGHGKAFLVDLHSIIVSSPRIEVTKFISGDPLVPRKYLRSKKIAFLSFDDTVE